jgi:hypothetical protein
MQDQTHPEQHQDNEKTRVISAPPFIAERDPPGSGSTESLFETYERRSIETIIRQQRAHKDSQAARAAKVILEGVVLPEFDHELHQSIEFEDADEPAGPARIRHIRVQRVSAFGRLASPGAQVIYILLILAGLGGTLGLASSTQSPHLLLMAGIATPMLLPICVWRWFCWLDASPYYYRLLTTLGEDARNLLDYRLLWKKEGS